MTERDFEMVPTRFRNATKLTATLEPSLVSNDCIESQSSNHLSMGRNQQQSTMSALKQGVLYDRSLVLVCGLPRSNRSKWKFTDEYRSGHTDFSSMRRVTGASPLSVGGTVNSTAVGGQGFAQWAGGVVGGLCAYGGGCSAHESEEVAEAVAEGL